MKTSFELERERQELLNPSVIIIQSRMNFEIGQIVGRNPTTYKYARVAEVTRGNRMRGEVRRVKNRIIGVKWGSGRYENIDCKFLTIY